MSTSTKPKHRPTPTQRLQARITELEAVVANTPAIAVVAEAQKEAARLDSTVQDLTRHLSTVTEHTFLINGGPARIVARRHDLTDHWGVIDGTLMAARYWSRYHGWQPTGGNAADMFPWTEREACRYASILAGNPGLRGEEPAAVVDVAAAPVEAEVQAPVGEPLPRRHAKPTVAEAVAPQPDATTHFQRDLALVDELGAMAEEAQGVGLILGRIEGLFAEAEAATRKPDAEPLDAEADPEATVTVPAPIDVPGYQPEPPDAPQSESPLSFKAASISANTEQETVALPQARTHGPDQTQQMAIPVAAIPPKPTTPPLLPDVPLVLEPIPPTTWTGQPKPLADALGLATADLKETVSAAVYEPRRGITVRLAKGAR